MLNRTRSIQALLSAYTEDHTDRNALPFDGIVTLGVRVPNMMQWKRNVKPLPQTWSKSTCYLQTWTSKTTLSKTREKLWSLDRDGRAWLLYCVNQDGNEVVNKFNQIRLMHLFLTQEYCHFSRQWFLKLRTLSEVLFLFKAKTLKARKMANYFCSLLAFTNSTLEQNFQPPWFYLILLQLK